MAYVKPQDRELTFAYRLLLYLHGNTNNTYLLLAIVAWLRGESGRNWIGNNPLNIRNSQYAKGYRQTKSNGHFAIFATVADAARATAQFLMQNHGNGYELIIKAAQRNGGEKDYATQAVDFLMALAMSKWDAGHYGTAIIGGGGGHYGIVGYDQSKNKLIEVWTGLLGHKITLPADVVPQPKAPPPLPAPDQPRSLQHVLPKAGYIQPYAAFEFYVRRATPQITDPGDPSTTGL